MLGRTHPQLYIHDDHQPKHGVQQYLNVEQVVHGYTVDAQAFCDANYVVGIDDRRSVSGQLLHVFTGPVCWSSSTQPLIAGSSTESEVRAAYEMTKTVLYAAKILQNFNMTIRPFPIKVDSKGARDTVTHYAHTKHTKHLEVSHDVMREHFRLGDVNYILIPGKYNPADIFTKALASTKFTMFRKMIGMAKLPVHLQQSKK